MLAPGSAAQEPRRPGARLFGLVEALVTVAVVAGCDEDALRPGVEAGHGGSESGVAGQEHAGGALGQGGSLGGRSGATGDAGAVTEPPAPHLLEATPADGSADVYPFPLPDGVSISLTFSETMSADVSELSLRAESGMEKAVPITWAESGREAVVLIAPNALTGAPPLLDLTTYALDLSLLTSQPGVPLDPQENLRGGALHFTTGAFDALLNHACGHVRLGPFDSAVAVETPGSSAVPTDTGHTNYSITLPEGAAGYEGYTRVTTLMGRNYHLLFDRAIPASLVSDSAAEESLLVEPAAAACDGITHRAHFSAEANEELFLHLGPAATSSLRLIVEIASDG